MGGLVCGAILAKEGYSVCVLEKNKQLGGCLQTYSRDKVIFDSGVHYLGGLDPGQNLYQIFKYLGLIGKLKLQRMDNDCFDKIIFEGDPNEYILAQGYENFIAKLLVHFPEEEKGIREYCDKIKEVCGKFRYTFLYRSPIPPLSRCKIRRFVNCTMEISRRLP